MRGDFAAANFSNARMMEAEARDASFVEAKMTKSVLSRAELEDADFTGADLRRSDFRKASLRGVKMIGANLSGANLSFASVRMLDLTDAVVDGANLAGTELRMVMGLTEDDLPNIFTDADVDTADRSDRYGGGLLEHAVETQWRAWRVAKGWIRAAGKKPDGPERIFKPSITNRNMLSHFLVIWSLKP